MSEKILVCVAWPYCNGDMHIGHIAGAYLPSDIFARYHRLRGNDVLMVSGSDTHGTPITVRAEEEGISPREVVDRYHPRNVEMMRQLGISFDLFTETDTENHWAVTQDMFLEHLKNEIVYRDTMPQLYCVDCNKWLADRYVEGTCPHCGYNGARGDQCDNCGRTYDATELINPRCKYCGGSNIEVRETEHFFLDLGALNDPLLEWVTDGSKTHWRPNVYNYTVSRLAEPRAARPADHARHHVGRHDPAARLRGQAHLRLVRRGHRLPVRLEGVGRGGRRSRTPGARGGTTRPPARYYFIGKDNIDFHTIIWPGMLIGYGHDLNLPYDVPGERVPERRGPQAQQEPALDDRHGRRARALRARSLALRARRQHAREHRRQLHVGRVRPPQQRGAGRHLGQPGEPGARLRVQALRRQGARSPAR